MKLTFLGATETVTGSKYLIESDNKRILVDCGLFQGLKELRLRNWRALPIRPSSLSAVALTHAHIDHSGYLPLLVKNGFRGPIYATKATAELCSVLLPDSGHLHEEDARRANQYGYSKHHPALPLYTEEDGRRAMSHFKLVDYEASYPLLDNCQFSWHRVGHILGSSFIQIKQNDTTIVFSGDVGRLQDPIMKPASFITTADYLILESTYGDRLHDKINPEIRIAEIINSTIKQGGSVLIPAFAVGRAQTMLYYLYLLKKNKQIPDIPVYLDSPMAIDATEILLHNLDEHKLTQAECQNVCNTATYIRTPQESKAINNNRMPKIIISASGMMSGGRVLHHLKALAPDPRNTILITGFQAEGTRGASLLAGADSIKIHGEYIHVKAKVAELTNTSAHADYEEILIWLKHVKQAPKMVFITHGEPEAALALKQRIETELGWLCVIPRYQDSFLLS